MKAQDLDYVLVPMGLMVLGMYHVWLLYTIISHPSRTVIGLNAQTRYQWILSMMTVSILFSLSLSLVLFVTRHLALGKTQNKTKHPLVLIVLGTCYLFVIIAIIL